jgi:hypothetical protein
MKEQIINRDETLVLYYPVGEVMLDGKAISTTEAAKRLMRQIDSCEQQYIRVALPNDDWRLEPLKKIEIELRKLIEAWRAGDVESMMHANELEELLDRCNGK